MSKTRFATATITKAGLTAGALDIIAAILVYAYILNLTTPMRVLQSVASGAFGKDAFQGGWKMAMMGLAFHFFIAFCFAAFYYFLYPYWKRFFGNPVIAGLCYGLIVWSIMNFLVLPVATGALGSFSLKYTSISIALIVLFVGIPISVIIDKRAMRNYE